MAPRTDIHSPTNLKTEDYEFVFCGIHRAPDGHPVNNVDLMRVLTSEGWRFDDVHNASQCSHCGQKINYYAVLKHLPTHTLIHVGETCLDNRFGRATAEFQKLRKQAQLDREAQRIKKLRETWVAAHTELYDFLNANHDGDNFYSGLWRFLQRNGELTERQVEALAKSIQRDQERKSKQEEEMANDPDPAPVIEGKIEITGKIIGLGSKEYGYGESRLVMTVLDDRGFKVWGTKPSALYGTERGDRVRFIATVEAARDSENFGFFKRPSKATVLEA